MIAVQQTSVARARPALVDLEQRGEAAPLEEEAVGLAGDAQLAQGFHACTSKPSALKLLGNKTTHKEKPR